MLVTAPGKHAAVHVRGHEAREWQGDRERRPATVGLPEQRHLRVRHGYATGVSVCDDETGAVRNVGESFDVEGHVYPRAVTELEALTGLQVFREKLESGGCQLTD